MPPAASSHADSSGFNLANFSKQMCLNSLPPPTQLRQLQCSEMFLAYIMPARSPRKRDTDGTICCISKRRQTVKTTPVTRLLSTCQKQCPPYSSRILHRIYCVLEKYSLKTRENTTQSFSLSTRLGSEKMCTWKFRWSLGNSLSASLDCEKYVYLQLLIT